MILEFWVYLKTSFPSCKELRYYELRPYYWHVYDTWLKYSLFHLVSCNFVSDSFYYIGVSNYKMSGITHRCVRSVGILLYFDFKPKANWCASISDTWRLILMSLKDVRRCHCVLRKCFYFHISAVISFRSDTPMQGKT